jgi:hypothetical protein
MNNIEKYLYFNHTTYIVSSLRNNCALHLMKIYQQQQQNCRALCSVLHL